jgi:hypothetical protein
MVANGGASGWPVCDLAGLQRDASAMPSWEWGQRTLQKPAPKCCGGRGRSPGSGAGGLAQGLALLTSPWRSQLAKPAGCAAAGGGTTTPLRQRLMLLIRPAHTWGSQSDGRRARSDGQGRRRAVWESRAASLRAPRFPRDPSPRAGGHANPPSLPPRHRRAGSRGRCCRRSSVVGTRHCGR